LTSKIPVTIWGATGFTGGELLRILAAHPEMEIAGAISRSSAGTPLGAIHPHLRHAYPDAAFISTEQGFETEARVAFLALPHKSSAETAKNLLGPGHERRRPLRRLQAEERGRVPEMVRRGTPVSGAVGRGCVWASGASQRRDEERAPHIRSRMQRHVSDMRPQASCQRGADRGGPHRVQGRFVGGRRSW